MRNKNLTESCVRRAAGALTALACALTVFTLPSSAASWNKIEPLKSRREDVRQALGTPLEGAEEGTDNLRFKTGGMTVSVSFVTPRLIAARKFDPDLDGTVLSIAVQHENSAETPETLKLTAGGEFKREDKQEVSLFTNAKEGLLYTFVGGKLKTTWYNPTAEQLARAQKK